MNRTVGASLRLAVGGGAIFAFGFGALASVPQPPITSAAAAAVVPPSSPIEHMDEPRPHPARVAVMLYVLATPEPTPAVAPTQPLVGRPLARTVARVPSSAAAPQMSPRLEPAATFEEEEQRCEHEQLRAES